MHTIDKIMLTQPETDKWITVDPGMDGRTGYAIWDLNTLAPIRTGVSKKIKESMGWSHDAYLTANEIKVYAKMTNCNEAFIEMPEFWSGSATSFASASKGDLFKLTFLVGCLYSSLAKVVMMTTLVTPRQWKGQLKKEMVDGRILHAIGETYPNHISDAVGIGLYTKGRL